MSTQIANLTAFATDIPLREVFQTAKSQTSTAQNVTVELTLENGIVGYGGATAMGYVTGESRETLLATIPHMLPAITGMDARSFRRIGELLGKDFASTPGARAAVEMALLDAFGKIYQVPVWRMLGGSVSQVVTDITVPICPAKRAEEMAREAWEAGYRSLKLKVGCGDDEADFERMLAIHRGAPQAPIRLDANQGFTPDGAIKFLKRAVAAGIPVELVEQPVEKTDLVGLKAVKDAGIAPVAADEAMVHPEDAIKIATMGAADVINIKLMKCGILGALDVVSICKRAGVGLMFGCMMESRIGMTMAAHLACGVGGFRYLDLDALWLATREVFSGGFKQVGDAFIPLDEPGLGCTLDA